MNTNGRLFALSPCGATHWACIFPIVSWPGDSEFKSWVNNPPKNWPDFLNRSSDYPGPFHTVLVISGRVIGDLLEAGLADGDFVPLDLLEAPIRYFAFRPRASIRLREVDVSAKYGSKEPAFSSAPDYGGYGSHAFVEGKQSGRGKGGLCLCIPEILSLAKVKGWTGVSFGSFDDVGLPLYECNERGKIKEYASPRNELIEGYYVPQEVIAADLVRARELAAELQNSPDTPEWTRRSFEMVRKALAEAPHTLGYPVPVSAKPRRVAKPDAPFIDPKALKRLKLEGEGELVGEIALGRPLLGTDTLSVTVSDEVVDDDAPEATFTKTEMKRRAKVALEKLESRLPAIEAALDQQAAAYKKPPAEFRATLHDPGVFLCTADMAEGDCWTFTVDDEQVTHHFEFDGDMLTDAWAGD